MRSKLDEEFERLQKIWYDKLKAEGFEDIEVTSTEERLLKEWDFNFFRNEFNPIKYETTVQYYNQARTLLHTFSFKSETQKKIWSLHCEGLSVRKIARHIMEYRKSTIHSIIKQLSERIKKD